MGQQRLDCSSPRIAPTWLLAFDAASFAFLGGQVWRTPNDIRSAEQPIDAQAAESGFRLLRPAASSA